MDEPERVAPDLVGLEPHEWEPGPVGIRCSLDFSAPTARQTTDGGPGSRALDLCTARVF